MQNCVVVSGTDAVRLDPGGGAGADAALPCVLERNTIAARGAVIRLGDAAATGPVRPYVMQARANVFSAAFAARQKSRLLSVEDDALAHGRLIWQGDRNVYPKDGRLYVDRSGDPPSKPPQSHATWARLWGPRGDRQPLVMDLSGQPTLDPAHPKLTALDLPPAVRSKIKGTPPGADLEFLGIVRKLAPATQ
jgi:hypothetical protein